jgi:septal ring factor EnvC (AmiA/AmiB activator)
MADATQEYIDLGKLEKDVESRRRQVQSAAFSALPSDVRNAFEASLKSAETNYEKKKVSLDGAINRLSETDFWPAIPSQKVGDMEAKLKEAKTMLGSLADSVGQLYKRIEGLCGQRPSLPSSSPSGVDEGATAGGSGDADSRAKKRRRVSSADGGDHGEDADATPPEVREDVESIKDTIREIEDRLQEVENDMTQRSLDIIEQLEVKMDEKIEEIARSADVAALVDSQLGPQTTRAIQAFDESFAQADREISELAQEMADLLPRLDELQRDNDLFKQDEVADKELFAQVRSRTPPFRFCVSSHSLSHELLLLFWGWSFSW